MKRLISIELQKIWMNKASRILTLTYFILLSFIALIAAIKFDIGVFKFHLAEMGIFNFPFIVCHSVDTIEKFSNEDSIFCTTSSILNFFWLL